MRLDVRAQCHPFRRGARLCRALLLVAVGTPAMAADTMAEAAAAPLGVAARLVEAEAEAPEPGQRLAPDTRAARLWRRAEPVATVGLALGLGDATAGWPAQRLPLSGLDRQEGHPDGGGRALLVGPVRRAGQPAAVRLIALRLGFREATPTQAMAAYAGMRRMQGGNNVGVAGSLALSAAAGAVWTAQHEGAKLAVIPAIGSKHIGIGVAASW